MEDIEILTNKIISDANEEAKRLEDVCEQEIKESVDLIKQDTGIKIDEMQNTLNKQIISINESLEYECSRYEKNCIQKANLDYLNIVLEKTKSTIESLPGEKYFDYLYKLFCEYAHSDSGVISFSEKDINIMPADFLNRLKEKYPVTLGEPIAERGFIIKYNGFIENCTINQIFEERKNEFLQVINRNDA